MGLKVIVTGATGMVGKGVLLECLDDPRIETVLSVSRKSLGLAHAKLRELVLPDLSDLSGAAETLRGYQACFFCLGISSAGMSEDAYARVTTDLTLAFARAVLNPEMTFCFVSGAGTDSSEKGRLMWARVKGRAENALLAMPFKAATMFRPGGIRPMRGVRSATPLYNFFYVLLAPLLPLLMKFPKWMTSSDRLGRAMIRVALEGADKRVLESVDINRLGK